MTTLADRGIAALRANYDDLAARVRTFDDADLAVRSGSREWTVAQVLSHLGSGAEIMQAGVRAAVAGDPALPDDFNASVWSRWDAMSPREQADGYLESAGRLMATLEALDEGARRDVRVPLGFLPEPADLALLSGMRLNEAALHSWDVRVAFDPEAVLAEDEVEVMIEQLTGPLGFMLGFTAQPDELGRPDASLRVETSAPSRSLSLALAPTPALTGGRAEDTDGTLTGPAEAFLRMLTGRLATVRPAESVTLESETLTLDQVRRVFPGF